MSHALRPFAGSSSTSKWGDSKMNFKSTAIFPYNVCGTHSIFLDTPKCYYFSFFGALKIRERNTCIVRCAVRTRDGILHSDLYNFSGQFNRFIHDMCVCLVQFTFTRSLPSFRLGRLFILSFFWGCTLFYHFHLVHLDRVLFSLFAFLSLLSYSFVYHVKWVRQIQRWLVLKKRILSLWFFKLFRMSRWIGLFSLHGNHIAHLSNQQINDEKNEQEISNEWKKK